MSARDDASPAQPPARPAQSCFFLHPPAIVLLCLGMYLATASGRLGTWDADIYYTVTENLVTRGRVDIPPALAYSHAADWRGRNGLCYAPFDPGQSLANIPFYLAGRGAGAMLATLRGSSGNSGGVADLITRGFVALSNTLYTALIVWVVWAMAGELGWGRRGRTACAAVFGFATMAWPYATMGFNQPLACLGQTLGVWGALRFLRTARPADALLAGGGCALAISVRLNTALALPFCALPMLWTLYKSGAASRDKLRALAAFVLPVAAAVLLALGYNLLRFETPWRSGYAGDANTRFSIGFIPRGMLILLLSPAKGLPWYVPAVIPAIGGLLCLARRGMPLEAEKFGSSRARGWFVFLSAGIAASYLLFFSAMAYGHSGLHSWGPRFFVPLMPLLGIAAWAGFEAWAARPGGRMFGVAILVLSVAIQAMAVVSDQGERVVAMQRRFGADFYERSFFSPGTSMLPDRVRAAGEKAAGLIEPRKLRPAVRVASTGSGVEKTLILDYADLPNWWWVYGRAMGLIPGPVLGVGILTGLIVLGWLAGRVRRDLRMRAEGTNGNSVEQRAAEKAV